MAMLKGFICNRARVEGSMAAGYLAAESMFYCSNILATIDSSCPRVWMEEREVEEDRLTGATQTRMLSSMEFTQLTSFMLNNSIVMEEWRIFYELSLIHISEPTRLGMISYAVFCLKK